MQPGAAPNWILPVVTAADNSVYNNFTFIWEMWRPLYWTGERRPSPRSSRT